MADCQTGLFGSFILSTVCCIGTGEMWSTPLNGRSNSRIFQQQEILARFPKKICRGPLRHQGDRGHSDGPEDGTSALIGDPTPTTRSRWMTVTAAVTNKTGP